MNYDLYIGIDIGLSGAISFLDNNGNLESQAMPLVGATVIDYVTLSALLSQHQDKKCLVCFEQIGVIFGSSKTTAFSMGHQRGSLEMLCSQLKLPYIMVPAKKWQTEMFKGIPEVTKSNGKRNTKAMALLTLQRLYPSFNPIPHKCRVPHDGVVDSVLIADYARRFL
jgi:hypothetical protein